MVKVACDLFLTERERWRGCQADPLVSYCWCSGASTQGLRSIHPRCLEAPGLLVSPNLFMSARWYGACRTLELDLRCPSVMAPIDCTLHFVARSSCRACPHRISHDAPAHVKFVLASDSSGKISLVLALQRLHPLRDFLVPICDIADADPRGTMHECMRIKGLPENPASCCDVAARWPRQRCSGEEPNFKGQN